MCSLFLAKLEHFAKIVPIKIAATSQASWCVFTTQFRAKHSFNLHEQKAHLSWKRQITPKMKETNGNVFKK